MSLQNLSLDGLTAEDWGTFPIKLVLCNDGRPDDYATDHQAIIFFDSMEMGLTIWC